MPLIVFRIAYCTSCKTLQFDPAEVTAQETTEYLDRVRSVKPEGAKQFWAHCTVCGIAGEASSQVFCRILSLSDL
jgi:hypothetical protein